MTTRTRAVTKSYRHALVAVAFGVLLSTVIASAKGWEVPVELTTSAVPTGLDVGAEVTIEIRFTATADLQSLQVKLAPFMGVTIVSDTRAAAFDNVKKGEVRSIDVTVRITNARIASLAVNVNTVSNGKKAAGARTIEFK